VNPLSRLTHRLSYLAIESAGAAIATLCDSIPQIEHRREIHMLRLRLNSYECRVSELEMELDGYKAMHAIQHGPTVDLPLTAPAFPVKRELN